MAAGKGDLRRPTAVSDAEFERRWAVVFARKPGQEAAAREIGQRELPLDGDECPCESCQ